MKLIGTQYEGRNDRIERIKIGDEVKLIREYDNQYDSNAILILNEEGSLGHIPANESHILSPMIDSKNLIIKKVFIETVKPLSAFVGTKKRCAEVSVGIEFEITETTKDFILEKAKEEKELDNIYWSKVYKKLFIICGLLSDDEKYFLDNYDFMEEIDKMFG